MAKLLCSANLSQGPVNFQELNLKQYRQLLKCFLGEELSVDLIFNNADCIIQELTAFSKEEIKNLSFLDYSLLLFYIRQVSIGDTVFLYVETPEQKQIKIDLRVSRIIEDIEKFIQTLPHSETIDQYYIEYKLPSVHEILTIEKERDLYSLYTFFLKSVKFNNTIINFENYSYKDRELITQKLPVKIMTHLTKQVNSTLKHCNEINILSSLKSDLFDKTLPLTLNSQILAFAIKLIFNTSLESVYELMFALSKLANFSCSFLDECSPGEFYFFTKKLEEINAKQQEAENNSPDILPPITSEFDLE